MIKYYLNILVQIYQIKNGGGAYMRLVSPERIARIDSFAAEHLNISATELMKRSAEAIAGQVRLLCPEGGSALILAGAGNNGADGYAAALLLPEYKIHVIDMLGRGQRSPEGSYYLELCKSADIPITVYDGSKAVSDLFRDADIIIDAILGAGARLPLCEPLISVCRMIEQSPAKRLAVDIPLGVDAKSGEMMSCAPRFDVTLSLCLTKTGAATYPARERAGKIVSFGIGLFSDKGEALYSELSPIAEDKYTLVEPTDAAALLPKRGENTSKGSFGRLAVIAGSREYGGALLLSLGGALRAGAGYVTCYSEEENRALILTKYPEVIFKKTPSLAQISDSEIAELSADLSRASAILIGPGLGKSAGLSRLLYALMEKKGPPLIIDADAINILAEDIQRASIAIKSSPRLLIFTPHPLEFARLSGKTAEDVQRRRLPLAEELASKLGAIVVLKGAGTVITDGSRVMINSSGSSALSKAGSGDVLAGVIASLIASSEDDPMGLCALAVYVHGRAGDILQGTRSTLGVIPSELPDGVALALAELQNNALPVQ